MRPLSHAKVRGEERSRSAQRRALLSSLLLSSPRTRGAARESVHGPGREGRRRPLRPLRARLNALQRASANLLEVHPFALVQPLPSFGVEGVGGGEEVRGRHVLRQQLLLRQEGRRRALPRGQPVAQEKRHLRHFSYYFAEKSLEFLRDGVQAAVNGRVFSFYIQTISFSSVTLSPPLQRPAAALISLSFANLV